MYVDTPECFLTIHLCDNENWIYSPLWKTEQINLDQIVAFAWNEKIQFIQLLQFVISVTFQVYTIYMFGNTETVSRSVTLIRKK